MQYFPARFVPLLSFLARAWSVTLNYQRINYSGVQELRNSRQPVVFAIFHNELFPLCYLHRNEGVIAVVSASRDGEILAGVLKDLGYSLARGSSSRQGFKAMLAAMRQMEEKGKDAVLTVDGPRGPRHVVKPGIVYLASRIKAFIVPVRVHMSTRFVFERSWDKFKLPWIWSTCRVVYGEPYKIPSRIKFREIDSQAEILEQKLNLLSETQLNLGSRTQ